MGLNDEEEDEERGEEDGAEPEQDDDKCPPPPPEEKEMLFLIEFLVDTMLLKPENIEQAQDMDPCLLQGQTSVNLTFLHFPEMTIFEKEGDPCKQTGLNYIKFNSGKSLMFALSESQFENPPPIYLDVSADKQLPHGSVPNKFCIGLTKICLSELFKQVFEKVDERPDKLPLSKSIKDKYQLIGKKKNCPTAEITIYIRLSCLGQNIVTEFQRGGNECEPFLFKSKESRKVYQCTTKETPEENPEDLAPPLPGWGMSGGKSCGDATGMPSGGCEAGKTAYSSAGSQGMCSGIRDQGPAIDEEDEYDEFGTEVHGHALTVKIQKSQKKAGPDESETQGDQVALQVPLSQNLCKKGKGSNKAELYEVGRTGDSKCGESTHIVHGVDSPDKDIFILRIGKKGETSGKGKLELELRTPKPKIERNIQNPRKWDKVVQTDKEESDGKKKKKN